jgi:1-aminocyclopropane-1-carboxylate deaminase
MLDTSRSILQEVIFTSFNKNGNRLFIKRDDLIHKEVSGNKWRKLKYNLESAKQFKKEGVLTFGGAYSNHLVATAAACSIAGFRSIGIVRGDELNSQSNETLRRCADLGMELHFVSRTEYDLRNEKSYIEDLNYRFPNQYIIPEGGANYLGMIGCQEIMNEFNEEFEVIVVAQGTTTTSSGLLLGLPEESRLWVVPVLRGFDSKSEMRSLLNKSGIEIDMVSDLINRVEVKEDYHFGGYGKYTQELIDFIESFYKETGIPLDPIYTAKAMFALVKETEKLQLKNSRILFIHTGGIQGSKSIFEKEKRDIY